jgi:uncharacterized protein (DUF433 family)
MRAVARPVREDGASGPGVREPELGNEESGGQSACGFLDGIAAETTMTFTRITHDPAVMGGKPCIRGMRVTVGTVLGLLATGQTRERILQAYPYLEPEDIDDVLAYAAWRLGEREEALTATRTPRSWWT